MHVSRTVPSTLTLSIDHLSPTLGRKTLKGRVASSSQQGAWAVTAGAWPTFLELSEDSLRLWALSPPLQALHNLAPDPMPVSVPSTGWTPRIAENPLHSICMSVIPFHVPVPSGQGELPHFQGASRPELGFPSPTHDHPVAPVTASPLYGLRSYTGPGLFIHIQLHTT